MSISAWLSGVLLGTGKNTLEGFGVEELTALEGLEGALAESVERPVFLFKHSTACPTSASAYRRVAEYLRGEGANAPRLYLVKVIESRAVSNEIAARLGVAHASPQMLLVRDGRPVWNASHGAIDGAAMGRALQVI